jgi:hypothetical protein
LSGQSRVLGRQIGELGFQCDDLTAGALPGRRMLYQELGNGR